MEIIGRHTPTLYFVNSQAAGNAFLVAGGAAGYVDTDISGSEIPANARQVLVRIETAAAQNCGVRSNVETQNTYFASAGAADRVVTVTNHSGDLILEFYRAAGNNTYILLGYWA